MPGSDFQGKAKNRKENPVQQYMYDNSMRLTPAQKGLIEETQKVKGSRMLSSEDELQFLGNLVKSMRGKKTIDIGVYTGYSSLTIAHVLPDDGKVYALDIDDEALQKVGYQFWRAAGVENKIDFRKGPALDSLNALIAEPGQLGTFDFAFIDADKENYDNYCEACYKLLRPGGLIAFDNMLWGGHVADPADERESTVALRKMAEKLSTDERFDVSFLASGDGTYLAWKR